MIRRLILTAGRPDIVPGVEPGLYQGDVRDLNRLKRRRVKDPDFGWIDVPANSLFTMVVNVGSTNWVPPDMYAIHFPMVDGPWPGKPSRIRENDWDQVLKLAYLITDELRSGGSVLVTCDMGISRSITMCGMVLAMLRDVPMDEDLLASIRSPAARPSEELWEEAVAVLRASIVQRQNAGL